MGLQFDHLYRTPLFLSLAFLFLLNILFVQARTAAQVQTLRARSIAPPRPDCSEKNSQPFADGYGSGPDSLAAGTQEKTLTGKNRRDHTHKTLPAQKGSWDFLS
jgi:hypothetical protein